MRPDEIFGIVDDAIDQVERAGRVPKALSAKRPKARSIPNVKIKKSHVPHELTKVDAGNVVYVPTSELQHLAKALDLETATLNRLMIRKLMPTLLSYQASANYARAALKEGLDVEIDFDPGMLDCVMHVGNLNVIMHFVRRSKLPLAVKRRFINRISDKLAEHAVQAMIDTNKVEERRQQMQELQAVVYERSKNKMASKTNAPEEAPNKSGRAKAPRKVVKDAPASMPATGVRKSRR